jgi:hypothetical protein
MGGARVRSSIGEEIATFRRSGLSGAWFGVNLDLSSPSRKAGRPASPSARLHSRANLRSAARSALVVHRSL